MLDADGNKLFQSEFINVIHPGSNLLGLLEYNLLNSSVALFGYYFAAFTIDRIWMGRRRMQVGASAGAELSSETCRNSPCQHMPWDEPAEIMHGPVGCRSSVLTASTRSRGNAQVPAACQAGFLTSVLADLCMHMTGCAVLCSPPALQILTSNDCDFCGDETLYGLMHLLHSQQSDRATLRRSQDLRQCLRSSWHAGWLSTR